jgi:hypothetical protein
MECIHMDAALTPPKAGHSKKYLAEISTLSSRAEINSAPTRTYSITEIRIRTKQKSALGTRRVSFPSKLKP